MTSERGGANPRLALALYGAANRMVRLHRPFLDPLGLTFPQYLVVLELLDASPRSVGELGARLGMETSTLTPLLKRLQSAGMVTRERDTADERRVLIDLTAAARAMEGELRSVDGGIEAACRLTPGGTEELRATLEALGHPLDRGDASTR